MTALAILAGLTAYAAFLAVVWGACILAGRADDRSLQHPAHCDAEADGVVKFQSIHVRSDA